MRSSGLWLVVVGVLACTPVPKDTMPVPLSPSPLAADAVAGVQDPTLRRVIAAHWEWLMRWSPTYATTLGDHRFDDQLAPRDAASIRRMAGERDALLAHLGDVEVAQLGPGDRVTYQLLRARLEADHAMDVCRNHEWLVDAGAGSLIGELSYLVESHTVKQPADAEHLIARMQQGVAAVDATIANLKLGLADGRVSSAGKLARAIAQLDGELAKDVDSWPMVNPAWASAPAGRDPWPDGARDKLHARLHEVVGAQIVPAMVRLRDFLRDEVRPHARAEREGLSGLPDGDACYRAAILWHVGLAKTPEELHALGEAEIANTDAAIAALGATLFGTPDLAATIAHLRAGDPALYFHSRQDLLAAAQAMLDRAKAAVPRFFSVLPKIDCVMREIPDYEAPYATIAYYRQPHYDGSKPGEYFVNTSKPETRPRFELEALTWHESIPGHHLQIALAMELGELPAFRKLDGSTAFVEGWALYSERLAGEMGLYSGDLDRLGQASYEAWRGARLVVDTGLHAMGWTRAQAEQYLRDHTALTEANIANEVDRYIGWPGQALAYKVGQLEILALRARAEQALGERFDLPGFHAVVLGAGAVTLPILDERVDAWIASHK